MLFLATIEYAYHFRINDEKQQCPEILYFIALNLYLLVNFRGLIFFKASFKVSRGCVQRIGRASTSL